MSASIILYSFTFIIFASFLRISLSILAFLLKTLGKVSNGLIVVVLFGFLVSIWNNPVGAGSFFRSIIALFTGKCP